MKNMKLSVKLIGGFSFVAAITLMVGIVGWYGINLTEKALIEANDVRLPAVKYLEVINEAQTAVHAAERSLLIPEFANDSGIKDRQFKNIEAAFKRKDEADKKFETLPKSKDVSALWGKVKQAEELWKKDISQFIELAKSGNREEGLSLTNGKIRDSFRATRNALDELIEFEIKESSEFEKVAEHAAERAKYTALGGMVFGTVLSVILGIFLSLMITRPINRITAGLSDGSEQVASAASQVSASSQHLAEGSSEQAASLEETSSSIEELSSMTKQNADHAQQAKAMMKEVQRIVENVNANMKNMAEAITDVTKSSEETGKIIKTIDEIAFQTNLLALNAAVEAARAGEAGAGFAVVADEVRNLAMRAAEAAKNTSNLIENTIKSVKNGNELTRLTQEAFKENVEISGKVGSLIDEIAAASTEQSHGISQINIAVSEMDKVVQQTAANAEETASASEELNAQAEQMKGYVYDLTALVGGTQNGAVSESLSKPSSKKHKTLAHAKQKSMLPIHHRGAQAKTVITGKGKVVRPDQVIPMEEGDFKDF